MSLNLPSPPAKGASDWDNYINTVNSLIQAYANANDSAMDNKADKTVLSVFNTSIDTLTQPGWYALQTGNTGGPVGVNTNYSLLEVKPGVNGCTVHVIHLLHESAQGIFERKRASANYAWSSWVELATAEAPTIMQILFASNIMEEVDAISSSEYWKNQFNEVTLSASYRTSGDSDDIVSGTMLFVLPTGYAPSNTMSFPIIVEDINGMNIIPAELRVYPDGRCCIFTPQSIAHARGRIFASFVAA